MLNKFLADNRANFYLIFRLLIGLMFLFHGLQKFGVIGEAPAGGLSGLVLLAAIIEVIAGLGITLGMYTQLSAVLGGIVMLYAFIIVHTPTSIIFTNNGGELALMYLAAFLVLATQGPGSKWVMKQ